MKKQRGVTLSGMVMVSVVVVLLLLLALKIVPVYVEYYAIEKHFKSMAADPKMRTLNRGVVQTSWASRAAVDDLKSMNPDLIEVTKEGDTVVVQAEYSVKVPLFRNVAACFDFHPTSK